MLGWIVNGLMIVFKNRIGQIILAALAWLGITWGTQTVLIAPMLDLLYDYVADMQASAGQGIAIFILQGVGMMKADIAFTMCISAAQLKVGFTAAKVRWLKK